MTPAQVALGYVASFAGGDPDVIAAWVTDDFANDQMGALGSRFVGKALYRQRLEGFLARFAGLRYEAGAPICDGGRVAVPYVMRASDQGRDLAIDGVMLITVRGDLVAARADYWDGVTYLQQIGQDPLAAG